MSLSSLYEVIFGSDSSHVIVYSSFLRYKDWSHLLIRAVNGEFCQYFLANANNTEQLISN
jgi:hypothetical protein